MAINERLIHTAAAAGGAADAEQGLILHLDANDVDSYDGDGDIWYDISEHDVTIPLIADDNNDLELHLNASDTTSYDPATDTTTWSDISGNSRNATLTSLTNTDHDIDNGGYFDFDGVNDHAVVSHFSELESSARTYEFWVNFDSLGTQFFAGTYGGTDATRGFMFRMFGASPQNTIRAQVYSGTGTDSEPTGTKLIEAGKWYHIVFVSDNSDRSFKSYINGELDINQTLSFDVNTSSTEPFSLGRGGSGYTVNRINGKIGQTRFYSKALSASEVGQNYRHGRDYIYTELTPDKASFTEGSVTTGAELELDANDYSGSGNWLNTGDASGGDGTISGATYVDDGNSDYFEFDGSNDYVDFGDLAGFGTELSLEVWVNPDGTQNQYSTLIDFEHSNDEGWAIYQDNNNLNQYKFTLKDGSSWDTSSSISLTSGVWSHLLFTVDSSGGMKSYLNGELQQTLTSFDGLGTTARRLNLGCWGGSDGVTRSRFWNGQIGQVRIYSSALTPQQVQTNYDATKGLYTYPNLFLHYDPANTNSYSGTGTVLTDLAGNNNADLLGGIESGWQEELGNSFPISGSGDGITTSSPVSINPATDGMTVEMWFNLDSDTQNYLFSFDGSETTYYGLSYRSNLDKVVFFYRTGSSATTQILTPTVTLNKWHHLVATTDGSGAQIYLDGVVGDTTTNSAYSYSYNEDLHFGNMYDLAQNSNTFIGQIRFYKGHLTADQVMQNYLFTKNDYPNGKNLTLYNSPTFEPTSPNYLRFDSANDEARLSSVNIPINGGFTISVYIRRHTSVSGYHQMLRLTGTGYTGYLFLIAGNSDTQYFTANDGTGNSFSTFGDGRTWTNNQWIHVLYTKENGNGASNRGELYINGTSIKTATNLSDNTDITNVFINRDASFPTSRNAQCDVGYMKIYDKPFTDDEALAEFNATKDDYGL